MAFLRNRPDDRVLLNLCIGIWICISNGAIFCFGIFSPRLKQAPYSYNQSQVNIISTVGAVASYISPPVGFIFDKFGPQVTLVGGALFNLIGWGGLRFVLAAAEPHDGNVHEGKYDGTFFLLTFFYALSQASSPFYEQGSVLANLQCLSSHRSDVVLIQKTFMGLGSSIISQFYSSFFLANQDNDTVSEVALEQLMTFLAVFSFVVGIAGAVCTPHRENGHTRRVPGLNNFPEILDQHQRGPATDQIVPSNECAVADETSPRDAAVVSAPRFRFLVALERYIAKTRYATFIWACTILSLTLVVWVSAITFIDTFWPTGSSTKSFNMWQMSSSVITLAFAFCFFIIMLLCTPNQNVTTEDIEMQVALQFSSREEEGSATERLPPLSSGGDTGDLSQMAMTTRTSPVRAIPIVELRKNSKTLWKNLTSKSFHMILLWYFCFVVWGASTLVSTNSSQIYQALDPDGYTDTRNAAYVSAFGVASALGRVVVGFLDKWMQGELRGQLASSSSGAVPTAGSVYGTMRDQQETGSRQQSDSLCVHQQSTSMGLRQQSGDEARAFPVGRSLTGSEQPTRPREQSSNQTGAIPLSSCLTGTKENEAPNGHKTHPSPLVSPGADDAASPIAQQAASSHFATVIADPVGSQLRFRSYCPMAIESSPSLISSELENNEEQDQPRQRRRPSSPSKALMMVSKGVLWILTGRSAPRATQTNATTSAETTTLEMRSSVLPEASDSLSTTRELWGWNVVHYLAFTPIILCVSLPMFLYIPPQAIILPFLLVGFCTGFAWGSVILIMSYIIEETKVGQHYGFLFSAGMITPIVFNIAIFANFYDDAGARQPQYATTNLCIGIDCVYPSLAIASGCCGLALITTLILVRSIMKNGVF